MARYGYARVSTNDQDTALQEKELAALGCTKILTEYASGSNAAERPKLQQLIEWASDGDSVVVMKLDRLARNTIDAIKIADEFAAKGVALEIRDLGGFDINSDTGRLIYTTLSAVAEMERKRIVKRTSEGRTAAMAKGVKFGPKVKIDSNEVLKLSAEGLGATEIAKQLDIGRASVYRVLKQAS